MLRQKLWTTVFLDRKNFKTDLRPYHLTVRKTINFPMSSVKYSLLKGPHNANDQCPKAHQKINLIASAWILNIKICKQRIFML